MTPPDLRLKAAAQDTTPLQVSSDVPADDPVELALLRSGLRRPSGDALPLTELALALAKLPPELPEDPLIREVAKAAAIRELRDCYAIGEPEARRLVSRAFTAPSPVLASPNEAPVRLDRFLADADGETAAEWLLEGLVARGAVTGVAGKPKVGKTTFLLHAALAVAEGFGFAGFRVRQAAVLWLNLETSERLARWKLRKIAGEAASEHFYIKSGTRADCTPAQVARWVAQLEAGLVVVDSLSKWWSIEEENSAAQTEAGLDMALHLARHTGAAVVLIHHTRKNRDPGASVMDMFRGSGAIGAGLDVGVVLSKRDGDERLRSLEAESRYDDTPALVHVRLGELTYERVADPGAAAILRERDLVCAALRPEPRTVDELAGAILDDELCDSTVRRRLAELVEQGRAERAGKRGRAMLYRVASSTPPGDLAGGTV